MFSFQRFQSALVAVLFLVVAAPSFAKDVTKQARSNDVASEYLLKDNGDLFRVIRGRKCQVTTNVVDFKVSQHPNDVAMIYYVRDENTPNLYVLHETDRFGDCPKTSKKLILADLMKKSGDYKFSVVSNTNTTIVNVALSRRGDFIAWDNTNSVLSAENVEDYTMHQKFGVSGAPFSSYVLFAINHRGQVLKVKGNAPRGSKWDTSETFNSLKEFKQKYNIQ
jgi:hypothetical protein